VPGERRLARPRRSREEEGERERARLRDAIGERDEVDVGGAERGLDEIGVGKGGRCAPPEASRPAWRMLAASLAEPRMSAADRMALSMAAGEAWARARVSFDASSIRRP
jgi:hypothetical protein